MVDTRGATGAFGGPFLSGGSTRSFTIPSSSCGIPATAQAYSLNITVVPHGTLGYLTTWPTGQSQPLVSTLNSLDGSIVANAAIVPAGTGGAISVFVTNDTDVIIDINGYFAPPGSTGALSLYTLTPCRVADTRGATGAFGGPSLAANSARSFAIPSSSCSVPATAQAYSLNVTVVPPGPLTYLTAWPTGQTQPVVSTLNSLAGKVVANAAIVPAGAQRSGEHLRVECDRRDPGYQRLLRAVARRLNWGGNIMLQRARNSLTIRVAVGGVCLAILPALCQAQAYLIGTVAGGGLPATPAPAVNSSLGPTHGVALDASGNVYLSAANCVFKVDISGTLTRVAGASTAFGYSGDGGPATSAKLYDPAGVAVDGAGNLYIADNSTSASAR